MNTLRIRSLLGIAAAAAVSFIAASAQQPSVPYLWVPVPIVAGGYVPGIVFHPAQKGLAYARTDMGGAYRWDAAAQRWIPLLDWLGLDDKNDLGVEGLAIDAKDAQRLYLAVGEYTKSWAPNGELLRSDDQGRTFQRIKLPFKVGGNEAGRGGGPRLVVDPANQDVLYLGTRHDGLWRSFDRASTWTRVESLPAELDDGVGVLAVLPLPGPDTVQVAGHAVSRSLYAVVSSKEGGLFHSADGAATWERVAKQPRGLLITNTALASNGRLYLSYGAVPGPLDETDGAVWRLDTPIGKWQDITPQHPNSQGADATPAFGYGGVAVSPDPPDTVLASTLDRWSLGDTVFRSTDAGKHWTDIASGKQPRFVGLSPWLNHTAPEHGTGAWPSTLAIDPFEVNHVMVGTGETVWETHEANAVDQNRPVPWLVGANGIEETSVLSILSPPSGPHLISAVADIGAFRHDDLSISPKSGSFKNPELATTTSIAYASSDPAMMVRVGTSWTGAVFGATSADQGVTWTPFPSQPAGTRGGGSVAITADGKTILWASDSAPISASNDLGRHWNAVSSIRSPAVALADPVNAAKLYLYSPADGSVLLSTDRGVTFNSFAPPLPTLESYQQVSFSATPGREGDLWIANDRGLFHAAAPAQIFVPVSSVEMARALGFGMPAPGSTIPTLFLFGRVHGLTATFASLDGALSWIRIDDDTHRFGNVQTLSGDPRIFGRVYLGTEGRGIIGGEPLRHQAKP
jgi:photosystem II stability/assembly factor-like uncharacterized protein